MGAETAATVGYGRARVGLGGASAGFVGGFPVSSGLGAATLYAGSD